MSLKWTVIISVLWVILVMVACIAFAIYSLETRAWPQSQAEERAAAMGAPAAIFVCVTLAPLWIYFAVKQRQRQGR